IPTSLGAGFGRAEGRPKKYQPLSMVTLIMSKFSLVGAESKRVKLGTPVRYRADAALRAPLKGRCAASPARWPLVASKPPVVVIGATCRSPPSCGARHQHATPRPVVRESRLGTWEAAMPRDRKEWLPNICSSKPWFRKLLPLGSGEAKTGDARGRRRHSRRAGEGIVLRLGGPLSGKPDIQPTSPNDRSQSA